jgi:hypothetical protein
MAIIGATKRVRAEAFRIYGLRALLAVVTVMMGHRVRKIQRLYRLFTVAR